MKITTVEDIEIKKSNRLKREVCDKCTEQLRGALSAEQVQEFEEAFYSTAERYLFRGCDQNQSCDKRDKGLFAI